MMNFILFLLFQASLFQYTSSLCESYNNQCAARVGLPLTNDETNHNIYLDVDDHYYFKFTLPANSIEACIDLSIYYGTVEIYAAKGREPKPNDYDFSTVQTGTLDHLHLSLPSAANEVINVLIVAVAETLTTAVVTQPQVENWLISGTPMKYSGFVHSAPNTVKFNFKVHATHPLHIALTLFSSHGDPSHAAGSTPAMTLTRPSTSQPITSDTSNSITLLPLASEADAKFTIVVNRNSINATSFSILQKEFNSTTNPVELLDGVPQFEELPKFQETYYVVQVASRTAQKGGAVSITLDSLSGDADLFVNPISHGFFSHPMYISNPATWQSQQAHGRDSVTITKDDANYIHSSGSRTRGEWQHGITYLVTVYAYERDTKFLLTTANANAVITLPEQFTLQGSVTQGTFRYYRFFDSAVVTAGAGRRLSDLLSATTSDRTSTNANAQKVSLRSSSSNTFNTLGTSANAAESVVMFDLQPQTGDADLFIACTVMPTGDAGGIPSNLQGHYNFSSTSYMEDSIAISSLDPKSCAYTGNSATSLGHVFYLAVYGYSDSQFTISAMHSNGVLNLSPGVPVSGMAYHQLGVSYQIYVGFEAQDLKLVLTPEYGDADLFVKINGKASRTNYDYHSNEVNLTPDEVTIPEVNICQDCMISVYVYGYETARFTILALFHDGMVMLSDGVPQKGSVSNNHVQYYEYQTLAAGTVTAVLTAATGQPTLYLSNEDDESSMMTVSSQSGDAPVAYINNVAAGTMMRIGVGGPNNLNSTYTVRVSEDNPGVVTLLTLLNDVPQNDEVGVDHGASYTPWKYYAISAPIGHEDIDIRATALVGNLDLYVVKCAEHSSFQCSLPGNLPNASHYSYSTANSDAYTDKITIHRTDAESSLYLVGVYTSSYYCAYQISSSFVGTILQLQPGVSVIDHVDKDEIDYFSYYFDKADDMLQLYLLPISGDPDLYVSTTVKHPTPNNYTWNSYYYGSDLIEIDPGADAHACLPCTYYVAVYGSSPSQYQLTASLKSTIPKLSDGVPTVGSVSALHWKYYSFSNNFGTSRNIKVHVAATTGNPDLYVNLNGQKPSTVRFDYKSTSLETTDEVVIRPSDSAYSNCISSNTQAVSCQIMIGIFGFSDAEYIVTLTTEFAATLLPLGATQSGTVASNAYTLYKVVIGPDSATPDKFTLRFAVTPYSGRMSLYASCANSGSADQISHSIPNATHYGWSLPTIASTGSILEINSLSAGDHGCTVSSLYFASVYGSSSSGTFTISAQLAEGTSVGQLVPNTAVLGTLGYHEMSYYSIRPGADFQDIRLVLTAYNGDVDLYISVGWDERAHYSTSEHQVVSYIVRSATVGNELLVLDHKNMETWCKGRDYCYFIVGAYGSFNLDSNRFSLLYTFQDATTTLQNGVPARSRVSTGHYEYFKYTLTEPDADLQIALTPLNSGDPDMFISLKPNYHPTRSNYTWSHVSYGADSLTIQADSIAEYCVPDPSTARHCDFYIGVYGWSNCSFSVLVAVDQGFAAPIRLIDQQPQQGHVLKSFYAYYRYAINVAPPSEHNALPPLDIKFILTSTDGGDADLYLTFGEENEPGMQHFDLKSTGYGSVSDEIRISADMPQYCTNCVVNVAVYGFKDTRFTLQATSSGITVLQSGAAIGGQVSPKVLEYYSFYNGLDLADITIDLTALSGDADLYITTYKNGDSNYHLPTRQSYTWRSIHYGDDSLLINYLDDRYCTDCDYLIGVYGFHNSTFTLMVTDTEAAVVKLAPNRPQSASIHQAFKWKYFSAPLSSSTAAMTFTVTPLDSGTARMFVQVYNSTSYYAPDTQERVVLPDPYDPHTYQYTTAGTTDNFIYVPGPHSDDSVFVLTIMALSPIRFTVVASSSMLPTLLQSGVPQNHFVEEAGNALFYVYPDDYGEDLRITLTSRSGDADLFVSAEHPNPNCVRGMGQYSYVITCSNFTWASRSTATDQIIISSDYPCAAVIPTTYVSASCDPVASYPKGSPIYMDVYGYKPSKFSIMAAPVSQQLQLVAGLPQLSSTYVGFVCANRNEDNGACADKSTSNAKKVQVAYFSLHVSVTSENGNRLQMLSSMGNSASGNEINSAVATEVESLSRRLLSDHVIPVSDVSITVTPKCNVSKIVTHNNTGAIVYDYCPPGCDCNPLVVYVSSCAASKCSAIDMKPSEYPGQHDAVFTVSTHGGGDGSSATLFLTSVDEKTGKTNKAFCDPKKVGEDCNYFIAVTNSNPHTIADQATFSLIARTPSDVSLIPCDSMNYPDGIRLSAEDLIMSNGASHYFELCSQVSGKETASRKLLIDNVTPHKYADMHSISKRMTPQTAVGFDGGMVIELEQCMGSTKLYACLDNDNCEADLPTPSSWSFYSDETQSCVKAWDIHKKDTCHNVANNKPSIELPPPTGEQTENNVYLMATGTGRFVMRVMATSTYGTMLTPGLVLSGMQDVSSRDLTVKRTGSGESITLSWREALVLMPGSSKPYSADYMSYTAYIFDTKAMQKKIQNAAASDPLHMLRLNTACGLKYASNSLLDESDVVPIVSVTKLSDGASVSHTIGGLKKSTSYQVVIVATCDSACLRQFSKTSKGLSMISCNNPSTDCKTQTITYNSAQFVTDSTADADDTGETSSSAASVGTIVAVTVVALVVIVLVVVAVLAYYYNAGKGDDDEINMTEMVDSSRFGAFFGNKSTHNDGDAETEINFSSNSGPYGRILPSDSGHEGAPAANSSRSAYKAGIGGMINDFITNPLRSMGNVTSNAKAYHTPVRTADSMHGNSVSGRQSSHNSSSTTTTTNPFFEDQESNPVNSDYAPPGVIDFNENSRSSSNSKPNANNSPIASNPFTLDEGDDDDVAI